MRTNRAFSIAVVVISAVVSTGTLKAQTGSKFTAKQAEEFVKQHNEVRKAAGVKVKVVWDKEIAKFAQAWADELASKGVIQHRPRTGEWKQKYGENIWAGSATFHKISQAVPAWASEKKDYDGGPITAQNFVKVGHYTQVIWDRTTKIGAGVAIHKKTNQMIVVCNYSPPGNQAGQKPISMSSAPIPPDVSPTKLAGVSQLQAGEITSPPQMIFVYHLLSANFLLQGASVTVQIYKIHF